jgi:hypothetical protein
MMTHRMSEMRRLWAGLSIYALLCLLHASASAAVRLAPSTSYSDVSNTVAIALEGDTVRIPGGTSVWTSPLVIGKAITLLGAGATATKIVNGTSNDTVIVSIPVDKPFRITGIFFDCAGWGNAHAIRFFAYKLTSIRIDHCLFNLGKRVIWFDGWHYGVVDHCTFINPSIATMVEDEEAGDVMDGDVAWTRPIQPGTINCVCVEDCAIILDNNAPGDNDEELYGDRGARVVWRNNTLTSTYSGATVAVDAHGNYGLERGAILYEVYSNTFNVFSTYRFCHLRGGSHLFFGNTFIDQTGTPCAISLTDEDGFFGGDNLTNAFFWDNTLNGAPITSVCIEGNPNLVLPDRQYWMHAPNVTNAFYPYKPLVYPHPLVAADRATNVTVFAYSKTGPDPLSMQFSSNGSSSASGVALTYFWTFGDGTTSVAQHPVHTYPAAGTYSYQLRVSDGASSVASPLQKVTVSP